MTTADDVLIALEVLAGRVPDRQVTPNDAMAAAWLPDLARYDRVAVFRAARTWSGDRFPSARQFLESVQYAVRELALDDPTSELSSCRECDGSGWVLVDDTGHGTYRRCSLFFEQSDRHGRRRDPDELVDAEGRARFLGLMREAM